MSESTQQLPPMPAAGPGQVYLSPVPADALPPAVGGSPAGLVNLTKMAPTAADLAKGQRAAARFKRGAKKLAEQSRAWMLLEGLDEEQLKAELLRERSKEATRARQEYRKSVKDVQKKLNQAAQQGHSHKTERFESSLASLEKAEPGPVDETVTIHELAHHKRAKATARCAAVVGSVAGAGIIGANDAKLLILELAGSLLAGGIAAWNAGRQDGEQGTEAGNSEAPHQMIASATATPPALPAIEPTSVVLSTELLPDDADRTPYPIERARTDLEAADCLLRAFQSKNLPVGEISDVVRQPWGWQMLVRVTADTPAVIVAAAGGLETVLDLPTGGFVPQPLARRRACAIVRLVMSDPFADAPPLPYRAPKSMSIRDKARFGTTIGGDPLEFSLAGVMGLVVAASGGGKTGLLQALGEATTACYDCITIDLDPHGDGLEDLHDAVRITGRSHQQIEATLLFLLMLSKGRARLRGPLGMGKKWEPSAERPAVVVIIDEYPKLTALAKQLAFELLLVGRKEGVWVFFASQGATTRYLGENIAQMLALRIVGPCKTVDTRAVFGDDAPAAGWLPHRLTPATDTDPGDAGHMYAQGMPGRADEPIENKIHETPAAVLRTLGAERQAAGLLDLDAESLQAMQTVDLPDFVEPTFDAEGNLKKEAPVELLTWERLLKLCDAEPAAPALVSTESKEAAAAVIDSLTVMDQAGHDRMPTDRLMLALRSYAPDSYRDLTAERLKALLKEAGAGSPVQLGAWEDQSNPRGYKREALSAAIR
jgi:S-DNA-T family DNA segregation ATPase FtsK/SpoIIIE